MNLLEGHLLTKKCCSTTKIIRKQNRFTEVQLILFLLFISNWIIRRKVRIYPSFNYMLIGFCLLSNINKAFVFLKIAITEPKAYQTQ